MATRLLVSEADSPSPAVPRSDAKRRGKGWWVRAGVVALGIGAALFYWYRRPPDGTVPYFSIPMGKVRQPLAYRIVSFHQGKVDKNLVKLAAQLGFNGVQVQLEGPNEAAIRDFAARDAKEHIVDYCHSLGMKVTVWVHELSDLPPVKSPDYPGPVRVDNEKLWDLIDKRYEWVLAEALPQVDGLSLTVVETQFNATEAEVMRKLVNLIDQKCRQHGKELTVRTFVWKPEELEGVMGAIRKLPDDIVVMSKAVPQDWQMRAGNAAEIGAVGNHPQIVEYDVAGEYFLSDNTANCMVDRLKAQFDYGLSKKVQGICVRVDRYDASVLWTPNEVNLWTLGMLASGASSDTEEIWQRWATYRYGAKAAPAVMAALKPTPEVVAEMLSVGPFTYGDTRGPFVNYKPSYYVALPFDDVMGERAASNQNWQMWRWDATNLPTLNKIDAGDPAFIDDLRKEQTKAAALAEECMADLEKAKPMLLENEYAILHTKLLTNKVQLAYRSAATLAALHWRQATTARTQSQFDAAMEQYRKDLAAVQAVAESLKTYPKARTLVYLGKTWQVDYPLLISPEQVNDWLERARKVMGGT